MRWFRSSYLTHILASWIASVVAAGVTVALRGSSRDFSSAGGVVQHLEYCVECENPSLQGSYIPVLRAKQGLTDFKTVGKLVYAVPNDGAGPLLNADEAENNILLVNRGNVALLEKAITAQEAGAIGVVIVDDGQCNSDFTDCGRTGGVSDGGFAHKDRAYDWAKVTIPVVLIGQEQAGRVKRVMDLRTVNISGLGVQMVMR